ncbi:protein kinase [Actinacidiphila alni]|uniref:serine/threonine-protein kinase n=1 Tax=Actinacidiphila alni TaxID=380248 RepID=UPI0033D7652F
MSSTADPGSVFQPLEADDPASVGTYRLAARLGSGGMGKVYLSYTPAGRPVAIKVIRPEFAEDAEFRRRFRQEVTAAARVHGLHTAPVIDSDADGAQPWLATAFVPGPTVAAAVSEHGPLPVPTVLLLVAGIAEALQSVHAAGIVHRDLKPSNVLLAADGPRVIDFGIARAADATSLTDSGLTIGTPAFMSPEQAAGRTVTEATDVFALGQVAAYAATGGPAYGDGPSHAVLYRIVHEEPDLSALPAELRTLVMRCLAKDPGLRPSLSEVVSMCQAASDQTQLVRPEQWLPVAVAAAIPERHAAPTYNPPAPGAATTPDTPPVGAPPAYTPTAHSATPPPAHPPTAAPTAPPTHPPAAPPTHAAATQAAPTPPPVAQPQAAQPPAAPQPPTQAAAYHQTPPPQHGFAQGPAPTGPQPQYGYPHQQVPPGAHPYGRPAGPMGPGGPGGPHTMAPRGPLPLPPKKKNKGLIVLAVVGALVVLGIASTVIRAIGGGSSDNDNSASSGSSSSSGTSGKDTGTGSSQKPTQTQKASPPKVESHPNVQLPASFHISYSDQTLQPREGAEDDLWYYCGGGVNCLFRSYDTNMVLLNTGEKGSLETCLSDTRYTHEIEQARLSQGSQICARTSSGSVALITFKKASASSDPSVNVVLDIDIWRNAIPAENS